jgi:DNA-binding CsgD family transcriptional regulator
VTQLGQPLSARQYEIWDLVRQGLTNAEIAERLGLKHRTVKHHTDALRAKLGLRFKRELIALDVDFKPNREET